MKFKRSLGQHFLKSETALSAIIEIGNVSIGDTILEIGPGRGALTAKLLGTGAKVIAVEKDDNLFELLKQTFEKELKKGNLKLIHADILEFDLAKLEARSYKLIANIPYYITGAILKKFLESDCQPEKMILLLQKEVAKRIVAQDGRESILSISVKVYGEPKYIQMVKAGSFSPAPKVDSAILLIQNISKDFFKKCSEKKFFELLRAGFKSKRKKLSSNLSEVKPREEVLEIFKKLNLDENLRAEDLGVEGWRKLVEALEN